MKYNEHGKMYRVEVAKELDGVGLYAHYADFYPQHHKDAEKHAQAYCDQLNSENPTRFLYMLTCDGGKLVLVDRNLNYPDDWENVKCVRKLIGSNDLYEFHCWGKSEDRLVTYFGTLGNEKYLPYKVERWNGSIKK